MPVKPRHDIKLRKRAAELFDQGVGYWAAATILSLSRSTVRKWRREYDSLGREALLAMGAKHRTYDWDTKCAAAEAVTSGAMTKPEAMVAYGVASITSLDKWVKAYRDGGAETLRPKPKGRPKGAKPASVELTREQELERKVQKLEAENAYLKKSIALKAEKRSRTARKPRS